MLNLEKLECLPTKETHRSNFIKADYYGDNFKKSANEFYGRGYNYARAVVRKHFNKPVKGLVYKLRNQTKCKHRSFKMAIPCCDNGIKCGSFIFIFAVTPQYPIARSWRDSRSSAA